MVSTGNALVLVGVPEVGKKGTKISFSDPEKALDALGGRMGSNLMLISHEDGSTMSNLHLGSAPVFDGMSAAGNNIFVATKDSRIICLE